MVLSNFYIKQKRNLSVKSLYVNGNKIEARNLASVYNGVFIASSVGLKDGQLLMTSLCILAWP